MTCLHDGEGRVNDCNGDDSGGGKRHACSCGVGKALGTGECSAGGEGGSITMILINRWCGANDSGN